MAGKGRTQKLKVFLGINYYSAHDMRGGVASFVSSFSTFSKASLNVEGSVFKLHAQNKSSNRLMPSHFIKPVAMKIEKGWYCWREINSNESQESYILSK